jgi:hypothetical protein
MRYNEIFSATITGVTISILSKGIHSINIFKDISDYKIIDSFTLFLELPITQNSVSECLIKNR